MSAPLCFVLMPFGRKTVPSGLSVDFDAVFQQLIRPAIVAAGLEPLRADEELSGGVIHKPMYERLILCDFAVADLTGANANVYYELGLRHGIRPATTVMLSGERAPLPFDVGPLRTLPYALGSDGKPEGTAGSIAALTQLLNEAQRITGEPMMDSPVFQLLEGWSQPDISRLKTDVFRDQARYAVQARDALEQARRDGAGAVAAAATALGEIQHLESGVVIDLLLSYRAVEQWQAMADLVGAMPAPLARSTLVQEQYGLALNRLGHADAAAKVLLAVIERNGPSSETYGLLGRVYKDRWDAELKAGHALVARGFLKNAIDAYVKGFETDWRDAFPGVNAVTLMTLSQPVDARRDTLLPLVRYAVERRLAKGKPDYWDHATRLELAVIAGDEDTAMAAAADALPLVAEGWMAHTTARNLGLVRTSRAALGQAFAWAADIEAELTRAADAAEVAGAKA